MEPVLYSVFKSIQLELLYSSLPFVSLTYRVSENRILSFFNKSYVRSKLYFF